MRSKNIFNILVLFTIALTANAQQKTGNVLLDAMTDEIDRGMTELHLPPFEKPFFIMYGIQDQKTYTVAATLGSLTNSTEQRNRFRSSARVLVGSYEFNDESLEDNLFSSPTSMDLQLPLDDDYMGIRRSFWSITDNVYRNAARHYEKHQQTLKESGKQLKDIPHRSFAKAEPTTLIREGKSYSWDRAYWESLVKELSALFLGHPTIQSSVVLNFTEGNRYLVNTEGAKVKVPFSMATFTCFAQSKTADGELGFEQLTRQFASPEPLKEKDKWVKEVTDLIGRIETQSSIPKADEEYTGPVLIAGQAVADLFFGTLLRGPESIMQGDNIQKLSGYQYNTAGQFESKIGKPVTHESLTIKAKPKTRTFNGVDLLGSFEIDDEGIVPADEEVIIEKGTLRSLLNNRTLTNPSQRANGFSRGPGVIEVTSSIKESEKQLKDKLIAKAKADGLEYAIIIRQGGIGGLGFMTVNKVSVVDGREEPLRHAYIATATMLKVFKKMSGVSAKYNAYNLGGPAGGNGNPSAIVSFIVPDQVLIDELEIKPMRLPSLKAEEYVSNPLSH
jgi:predicted Zn-dependent protease